jgi:predicted nucleic acid-binding protein
MYLLDANIWLERLLDQQQSDVVCQLLDQLPIESIFISDFTVHSTALALTRRNQSEVLREFVEDLFLDANITVLSFPFEELQIVTETMQKQRLDYDDAYQYALAERYDLQLISFDADFERTERRRQTPNQVLDSLAEGD